MLAILIQTVYPLGEKKSACIPACFSAQGFVHRGKQASNKTLQSLHQRCVVPKLISLTERLSLTLGSLLQLRA